MSATTSQMQWDKDNTIQVKMKLNKVTDADVIEWLNSQQSKQTAIKELIRKEIREGQK